MIPLGHIRTGIMHIAKKASALASEHGEIAVYVGDTGNVIALAHHDRDYRDAMRRNARRLAGVYRHSDDPGAPQIARYVRDDLLASMGRVV